MSAWMESVLAAEARKAGIAREDMHTRLTPRPPPLKEASECPINLNWLCVKKSLKRESNVCKAV